MREEKVVDKPLAQAMPATAALVAELRKRCGAELVNAAIAAGQRAKREYARLEAERGPAEAQAWLRRQKFATGRFWASEAGHEVGIKRAGVLS